MKWKDELRYFEIIRHHPYFMWMAFQVIQNMDRIVCSSLHVSTSLTYFVMNQMPYQWMLFEVKQCNLCHILSYLYSQNGWFIRSDLSLTDYLDYNIAIFYQCSVIHLNTTINAVILGHSFVMFFIRIGRLKKILWIMIHFDFLSVLVKW